MAWAGAWGAQHQQPAWGGGGAAAGWGMANHGYGAQQGGYAQQMQAARPAAAAGGWGAQQTPAASPAPAMPQQQAPAAQANSASGSTLTVTGCTHATVGGIVRGVFQQFSENHGKPTYKKDGQVNGLDVMCYFWDERDGPGFCGWWFGPVVGGDQVWAYHTDKAAATPPSTGWKVPYDGPVDPTLAIASKPKAAAAPAAPQAQTQPAQSQWQPAQSQWSAQPAQSQWNVQQQMQQTQQQKLMEQRKQMEAMQQQRMQESKKKMMEEQKNKLEENRKKLEEANRLRIEEQKKKAEELQRKRDEEKQKVVDAQKAKLLEQQAVMTLRRGLQKYKAAMPQNLEALQKEFDECVAEQLPKLVTQKEALEKDIANARELVRVKIENLEKQRREKEEKEKAETDRRRALRETAEGLVKELTSMVDAAETCSKGVVEEAEPFTDAGEKDMTLKQIESAGIAVESAGKDFEERTKACFEFVQKNAGTMKNTPPIDGEPAATCTQDLQKLLTRLNQVKATTTRVISTATSAKTGLVKKAGAKAAFEKHMAVFKKYDTDKDNMLNQRELKQLCKGEYKFTISADSLELICSVLVAEGDKGVKKDDLHRLKVMIGLAREKAMDEKRREQRLSKEKEVAKLKKELEEKIAEANKEMSSAAEEVSKVEKHMAKLPGQAKGPKIKAVEMVAAGDEAESMINAAKSTCETGKESLASLDIEVDDDLKSFLTSSVKKLKNMTQALDVRLKRCTDMLTKYRTDAGKRNTDELEELWAEALGMIRHHKAEKKLTNEAVFKEVDKKKDGKIDATEFSKFFSTCVKKEETQTISEEDLGRLFTHLDSEESGAISKESFINLTKHFMKVLKATIISDNVSIKEGKTVRRLEPDEVVEVLKGPIKEDSVGIDRIFVKVFSDGTEGWLTPVGNQGTVFLKDGGNIMKVVKETILTGSFKIGDKDDTKTKKLKPGAVVEIREWGRKEESSGLTRMKVKVKSDGQIGWVTSVGNTGIVFLEIL